MIYCVWYPSGGFGHFVNAILTLHGDNFVSPKNTLEFSSNGNSHNLELVAPKYLHDPENYFFNFDTDKNYSVLIDNGIDNESSRFQKFFPDAKIIKICYNDYSWPVVVRTMIEKAMGVDLELQVFPEVAGWNTTDDWVVREKYFLYLRDNALRQAWRPTTDTTIHLDELFDYSVFFNKLNSITKTNVFEETWNYWRAANDQYISPVKIATKIMSCVLNQNTCNMCHIKDIWTQSVIYYYIWLTFNIEVPHNDFANFFTDSDQILKLVS